MKVNYIDENGNNVTKEIEIDFNNISEVELQKCFKGCTAFNADKFILENVQNYSLAEIQEIFKNCKNSGD